MCQCQSKSCCCSSGSSGCGSKSSCGCQKSQCGQQSCSSGSCGSGSGKCDFPKKFLELADQAWMEVLKEKIKERILSNAPQMDELAGLISEANHERWQKKMENEQCCGCYEERLREFFKKSCPTSAKKNNNR